MKFELDPASGTDQTSFAAIVVDESSVFPHPTGTVVHLRRLEDAYRELGTAMTETREAALRFQGVARYTGPQRARKPTARQRRRLTRRLHHTAKMANTKRNKR